MIIILLLAVVALIDLLSLLAISCDKKWDVLGFMS